MKSGCESDLNNGPPGRIIGPPNPPIGIETARRLTFWAAGRSPSSGQAGNLGQSNPKTPGLEFQSLVWPGGVA